MGKEKEAKPFNLWFVIIPVLLVLLFIIGSIPSSVTFQTEKELSYQVVDSSSSSSVSLGRGAIAKGYVDIRNTDTEPGTFIVDCGFIALKRDFLDNDRLYILPGETKRANCEADTSLGEDYQFDYKITPGTKIVTKTLSIPLYQKILGIY